MSTLCITLPKLSAREAEAIFTLAGQLAAAIWDAYGHDILAIAPIHDPPDELDSDLSLPDLPI